MSIFDTGGSSGDLAGWSFGGYSSFNSGVDYYGNGNPLSFSGPNDEQSTLSGGIVGWAANNGDAFEQAKMAPAYGNNGAPFDWNAATLGISRLIDTGLKGYVAVKGAQAATYAGQNGLTYVNGQGARVAVGGGGVLPLLLLAGAVFLIVKA